MPNIDLSNIDLQTTPCPQGTTIDIEDYGAFEIHIRDLSLAAGIIHAYTVKTRRVVLDVPKFLEGITVLELRASEPYIKVRVTE